LIWISILLYQKLSVHADFCRFIVAFQAEIPGVLWVQNFSILLIVGANVNAFCTISCIYKITASLIFLPKFQNSFGYWPTCHLFLYKLMQKRWKKRHYKL